MITLNRYVGANMVMYIPSGEWVLVDSAMPAIRHVHVYDDTEGEYIDVTFWLKIKRKPLYYIFNLILPCVCVTLLSFLVFLLPPESGEKVSLSVAALLSMTFFLALVSENTPTQSMSVPLISK